jgi:hypothetical protein
MCHGNVLDALWLMTLDRAALVSWGLCFSSIAIAFNVLEATDLDADQNESVRAETELAL